MYSLTWLLMTITSLSKWSFISRFDSLLVCFLSDNVGEAAHPCTYNIKFLIWLSLPLFCFYCFIACLSLYGFHFWFKGLWLAIAHHDHNNAKRSREYCYLRLDKILIRGELKELVLLYPCCLFSPILATLYIRKKSIILLLVGSIALAATQLEDESKL